MHGVQAVEDESRLLRWGGLAGVLGGVVLVLVFVIVGVFVGAAATDPGEALSRFPEIQAARTLENGLYLAALILWIPSFLALYRAVRRSLAPALFGTVLGVVGLTLVAAGALPHVATVPVSSLYQASGATPDTQAVLLLIWRASSGIFDALLFAGLAVLPTGVVLLGIAMIETPAYGRRFGWFAVSLGVIGAVSAVLVLADPGSPVASLGIFALIAFHTVSGWKTYTLSRSRLGDEDQVTGAVPAAGSRTAFEGAK